MIRRPPRSTHTDTLFPYTTIFRSLVRVRTLEAPTHWPRDEGVVSMKPTVFVHTNDRQMVGAIVSAYSLQRNASNPEAFDVRIIRQEDYPFFQAREGQSFLRAGGTRVWRNEDLQSFTPLRFMPPELMGWQGRAVAIDPDVFAVGDIGELLARAMQGRSEERRVGKEWVSTGRSRWVPV